MTRSRRELLAKFNCNPPAAEAAIQRIQAALHFSLPADYVDFLRRANGGEGFIGNAYVILYPAEELTEANEGYGFAKYAPGLFLFGSDGGGEGFAFDMRSKAGPVVCVTLICMELAVARPVDSDFSAFLEELFDS
jgi:hypothetical protein